MNKKLVKEFLIITFVIMIIFWGGCALISQIFDITVNNIFLRIMHIIGGFSPTISSYISLKRNSKVKNFKEWIKKIFDIKHNFWTYLLVILFVLIYYVLGCVINGFSAIFVFNFSLLSCFVTLIVTIVTSLIILNINKNIYSQR